MVSIDPVALTVQIINFLVLIWALNKVLYKPIRRIIARRNEKVAGLEENITRFEQDALEKDQALKAGIREAREKALKEKEAYEAQARQEEMKLIEQINEQSRAELVQIREKIVKEVHEARSYLQQQIDSLADDISRKILGRATS